MHPGSLRRFLQQGPHTELLHGVSARVRERRVRSNRSAVKLPGARLRRYAHEAVH